MLVVKKIFDALLTAGLRTVLSLLESHLIQDYCDQRFSVTQLGAVQLFYPCRLWKECKCHRSIHPYLG